MNKNDLIQNLNAIHSQAPLVHNITNYVVMNNTANALLALGASPVMIHAEDEVVDLVSIASALVINIGTIDRDWEHSIYIAGKAAHHFNKPFVLDPVGAGATPYRTRVCLQIIDECHPNIIRGNASEIMALVNFSVKTKGVDSLASSSDALESAKTLALSSGAVVVISGQTDYITDGHNVNTVPFGSPMMKAVTGLGCTASAITGAFVAVNSNFLEAATHAMETMSIAGVRAAGYAKGSGSLQLNFLDELYNLSKDIIDSFEIPSQNI